MKRLCLVVSAAALLSFVAVIAASAAPLPFAEQDSLQQVFLAASKAPGLPPVLACGPYCDTTEGSTTPTATAIGSSCSIAQSNLTSQLRSYGNSFCGSGGSCALSVTTTVTCHADSGGYSVSGYATFGCRDSTC